jgi:phosphate transport system substrate-binding protein
VRMVPLAVGDGKCFDADVENAYAGDYPLARFLYLYLNKRPSAPLDPLMTQFIKYALSREGQAAVLKDGFYPLSKALADEDLENLGIR